MSAVFFDAAGTLFHVKGSVADIYLTYAERYGVKRSPEMSAAVAAAFRRAFHDAPPPAFAVTDPSEIKRCERLWWFDIVHHVFYRVGMFEGFDDYFDEVYQAFDGPALWTVYPETFAVLKTLKDAGYELGIISNFDSRLFNVLRGLGLAEFFETVTISSLAHAAKPSPAIFRCALEKHALDPADAVHVGDSVRDDVHGALAAGIRAVLLDRDPASTAVPPLGCSTLRALDQLPPLLGGL
ncbi:HAD-IA family hydrolase [Candidatus Nitrospira bockiana]